MATPAHSGVAAAPRFRLFYVGTALFFLVLVLAGFAPSYYFKSAFHRPDLPLLLHLHGLFFTLWIVLFLVQTTLVAAGRPDIHRRLGIVGAALAGAMVLIVPTVAIKTTQAGFRSGPPAPLSALSLPFVNILVFATLVVAGFFYRRQPALHKRLMLLATVSIVPAATARLPLSVIKSYGPVAFFGLTDLVLLAAIAYDALRDRRFYAVYGWGLVFFAIWQPLSIRLGSTTAWLKFAGWLTR